MALRRSFAVGVEALDAFGNLATGFGGTVVAALTANPHHNALRGTLSLQASGGEAIFTDPSLTKTGKAYAVTITSSGLTPAATSVFNVIKPTVAGGPAAGLRRSSRFLHRSVAHASGHLTRTALDRSADRPAGRGRRGATDFRR